MDFLLKIFLLNLLPVITGVIVSKKGKPYNIPLTSLHKIVSLAIIVVSVIMFSDFLGNAPLTTTGCFFAILSSIFYIAAIGTGGRLTYKEEGNEKFVIVHKIVTIMLLVSIFLTFYLPNN